MGIREAVNRLLSDHGEDMILNRVGEIDITLRGHRVVPRRGMIEEIGNSTGAQQEFHLKIGTKELLASAWASKVPVRTDRITVSGRARSVLDVRPLTDAGVTIMYELVVAG